MCMMYFFFFYFTSQHSECSGTKIAYGYSVYSGTDYIFRVLLKEVMSFKVIRYIISLEAILSEDVQIVFRHHKVHLHYFVRLN
jgi:hypothetical protein